MAAGLIEIRGSGVFWSIAGGGREARFPLGKATPKLQGWAKRYDRPSERDDEGELAMIGRETFDRLDRDGWASAWAEALGDDRTLEIKVGSGVGANEVALLDAPCKLLGWADGPLALDAIQLFVVSRRVGKSGIPLAPRHAELQLMFMAAAPISGAGEIQAVVRAKKRA
jgi:hypothetical protein